MGRGRNARLAAASALCALGLSGCGWFDTSASPPVPAGASGADPTVAESPVEADAVMTCATIDIERAGIAQSLQRIGASTAAADLRNRDAALAQLAALKRCAPGS
jgi:hypothetical protein